jgi:shikimate kinase
MLSFNEFCLQEGVNDPSIFKAVFLAGGPGSGKSFIVGKTALSSLGFRVVNSDIAFEKALEKLGLEASKENVFSDVGQERRMFAKTITAKQLQNYIRGRLGIVIDGTGKDYDKINKQRINLEKLGYETAMIFVNTDLETAIKRDALRKRTLGADAATKMWKEVQSNMGKFQSSFRDKFFIVDNSEGSDFESGSMRAYKKISGWAKDKPHNSVAQQWIKSQLTNR